MCENWKKSVSRVINLLKEKSYKKLVLYVIWLEIYNFIKLLYFDRGLCCIYNLELVCDIIFVNYGDDLNCIWFFYCCVFCLFLYK